MLQRAANNAYSWWWASHIRTKQSKWLEQNLQDMEDKVGSVLKLIEEDGDSFRKRAEMYYKKRPELINFVEESFRAYRALAERYDHISKELQNANNTIATVFPERVQFGMEDDDDIDVSPGFRKRLPESFKTDVPKDLKLPVADFKGLVAAATKKFELKNPSHVATGGKVSTSGLSKQEGLEEIDKLQRRILALQTEKEFVTNMYESSVAKYWELEKEVEELQDKVSSLQDEFGAGSVIEDDEARNLMAGAALKSCREALGELQEKQEKSAKEAKLQFKRIEDAREKLDSLRDELLPNEFDQEKPSSGAGPVRTEEELKILEQEAVIAAEARNDLESLRRKIKEHFEVELGGSLTVSQMADKIDELVSKVGSLETAVSSQTAQIQGLKTETDDLHAQIQTLEDDKATLLDGKNELSDKLRKKEEEWNELQELKRRVEEENCNLQTRLTEAHCNLEHLSEKLPGVQLDEEPEAVGKSGKSSLPETDPSGKDAALDSKEDLKENDSLITSKNQTEASLEQQETTEKHASVPSVQTADNLPRFKEKESGVREHKDAPVGTSGKENGVIFGRQGMDDRHVSSGFVDNYPKVSQEELVAVRLRQGNANERDCTSRNESEGSLEQGTTDKRASIEIQDNVPPDRLQESAAGLEDEPDWRHLFLNGVNDKEKVLLSEYTAVLRDYKEAKKVLTQLEARYQTSLLEITVQLQDLKNENSLKELEILHLRQKLKLLQEEIGQSCQCNCHRASSLMNRQCAESTVACEQPDMVTNPKMQSTEDEEEMAIPFVKPRTSSPTEEKFRMAIDKLLEENLDFWLRFSTSFSLIQKFDTEVIDLRAEVSKLEERHKQEGSSTSKYSLKTDVRPIYKHLREVQTELALWVEKSVLQKEELKQRSASLRNMQEEIMKAMKQSAEDDEFTFTSYQVAKFQGEILNMKQENNKVAKELQAGLDHVKTLLLEVERALARMAEEFGLSGSKGNSHLQPGATRSRIPLRTFIFGVKEKKSRSIFSFVHPALHRKNNPWR